MKVAVLDRPYHFRFDERSLPGLKPGWALIKVRAAGICGSDLHYYRGEIKPDHELIRGHEIAGIVADPGDTLFIKGQPVVVNPLIACGSCTPCRRGERHLCDEIKAIGIEYQGGFAEYMAAPAENIYVFHAHKTPFYSAAMADCVAVAVHALHQVHLKAGESVLVMGDGTIGLLLLQLVLLQRAVPVFITGKHDKNLNIARDFSIPLTFNTNNEDFLPLIKRAIGHADVVFEAVGGKSPPLALGISLVRKGGRLVVLGLTSETKLEISWMDLVLSEKRILGVRGYNGAGENDEMRSAIDLIENGTIHLESIITHRIKFDAIQIGFYAMLNKEQTGCIKAMVLFDE